MKSIFYTSLNFLLFVMFFKAIVADDSKTVLVYGFMSFVINIIILITGIITDFIMRRYKINDKAIRWILLCLFFLMNEILWSTIFKEPVMLGLFGGNGLIVVPAKFSISLASLISLVLLGFVTLVGRKIN